MDIKDFILIGGGLLIAAVILHGFWLAWRGSRDPLPLNIRSELIPPDEDEFARFKGELPSGRARVRQHPEQEMLPLEPQAPLLLEPHSDDALNAELFGQSVESRSAASSGNDERVSPSISDQNSIEASASIADIESDGVASESNQPRVTSVTLSEQPIVTEPVRESTIGRRQSQRSHTVVDRESNSPSRPTSSRRERLMESAREMFREPEPKQVENSAGVGDELIVVHVLARAGGFFEGAQLCDLFTKAGLKFGDMNIFHRQDPLTKLNRYSVANAMEPGVFDLAEIETMRTPGVSFFLRLPGPEPAIGAFEDLIEVARSLALDLGGELRDEQMSVVTGQTVEHLRHRVTEFARRRMSKQRA